MLLGERPVLFDALEFDEALATTDTLYDLAFLLMDLTFRGYHRAANHLLNRYLQVTGTNLDLFGLRAMPLFLALRAAIRAMVSVERAEGQPAAEAKSASVDAGRYLAMAIEFLRHKRPRLIAIGGYSGTGKTTLAKSIAFQVGAEPGAIHLRSDIERKQMLGAADLDRLNPEFHRPEINAAVYDRLAKKTNRILRAGFPVIVDATFLSATERWDIERLALRLGVPFTGLWLTADKATASARVRDRKGDASDATPEVVARQYSRGAGPVGWLPVASGTSVAETVAAAHAALTAAHAAEPVSLTAVALSKAAGLDIPPAQLNH